LCTEVPTKLFLVLKISQHIWGCLAVHRCAMARRLGSNDLEPHASLIGALPELPRNKTTTERCVPVVRRSCHMLHL